MPSPESEVARIVGLRIQHARQESLLTQRALEQLSGIDVSNIGKYERGTALPNLGSLIRIAHALGIDPGELMQGPATRSAAGQAGAPSPSTTSSRSGRSDSEPQRPD